jgi:hypothetical protein
MQHNHLHVECSVEEVGTKKGKRKFLCFEVSSATWRHMKEGTYSSTHSQILSCMEASDKFHALTTLTMNKNFAYSRWKIDQMGTQIFYTSRRIEISLSLLQIETTFPCRQKPSVPAHVRLTRWNSPWVLELRKLHYLFCSVWGTHVSVTSNLSKRST